MIAVRNAGAADAAALSHLHETGFEQGWSEEDILTLMRGLGAFALAAEVEGTPGGFILCRVVADEAEILTIATRPALRRRGVAAALIEAATATCGAAGAASMFLEVAVDNLAAASLYASRGFRAVGRRERYYSRANGPVAALIMRRDLNI